MLVFKSFIKICTVLEAFVDERVHINQNEYKQLINVTFDNTVILLFLPLYIIGGNKLLLEVHHYLYQFIMSLVQVGD